MSGCPGGGRALRSYDSHVAILFDEMEKDQRDWDSFGILRVGPALPLGRIAFLRKIYATLQSLTDVKRKHEQKQAPPVFDRVGPVLSVSCFSFPAGCEAGSVPPYRAY